ncbi:MAG: hypothetical protein FJ218_08705 [Ignavibacteria bacterium]|nr:hypothetical protein [Ignavibacteria bacterium]
MNSRTIDTTHNEIEDDIPIEGIMHIAEIGGAFDFLYDEREDIYTINDLKTIYNHESNENNLCNHIIQKH